MYGSHRNYFACVFCFFVPDILLPTTHLAPRSLCMRRTARWLPAFSGCGRSLIRWECGGQWRVFWLSMNTDYLMCCFFNWEPLSSNCELLILSHRYEAAIWAFWLFTSLLQAWGRVESWGGWGGGSETPDDWGDCITPQPHLLIALVIVYKHIY